MSFDGINLKGRYKPETDNIIEDFFDPILTESKTYYRVAGFFSSGVIKSLSRGLSSFIKNNGKIKLIVSIELSEKDIEVMNMGYNEDKKILERKLFEKWGDIETVLKNDYLEALAWMIAKDILQIKIGVRYGKDGALLPPEKAKFHQKFAIFVDENENKIFIEGSINETKSALESNDDSFTVMRSWGSNWEVPVVKGAYKEFLRKWNDNSKVDKVFSFPQALEKKIIRKYKTSTKPKPIINGKENEITYGNLWSHQKQAVDNWIENNRRGIFKMATGSGKTWAALVAIKQILTTDDRVVLLTPTKPLLEQWSEEIKEVFKNPKIRKCSSDYKWKNKLGTFISSPTKKKKFILSTMNSAIKRDFYKLLNNNVENKNLVVLIDEVHNIGSEERRKFLKRVKADKGRLGLSATPKRYNDPIGNEEILNYFGKIVKNYSIEQALGNVLCPYEYYIEFVTLEEEKLQEYEELTNEINKKFQQIRSKHPSKKINEIFYRNKGESLLESFSLLCIERARLLKKSKNKLNNLEKLIKNSDKTLIYCEDEDQLEEVAEICFRMNISTSKYTSNSIQDYKSGKKVLNRFENGETNILLAIRCLDEGLDIPSIRRAILISNTHNPRQWIQRRGRILRKSKNKKNAIIHDFFVLPYKKKEIGSKDLNKAEKKIIESELERVEVFRKNALNSDKLLIKIDNIKELIEL